MKNIILASALVVALVAVSCEDELTCNTDNPLEELGWLKELAAQDEKSASATIGYYIYQGTYNKQVVFINDACCPACMVIVPVYNCEGQVLDNVNADQVGDKILIWQSEVSPCPRR